MSSKFNFDIETIDKEYIGTRVGNAEIISKYLSTMYAGPH